MPDSREMPNISDLSLETKRWLARQANIKMPRPEGQEFNDFDILKVPTKNGESQLYLIDRHNPLGAGSGSSIYRAYPLSKLGDVDQDQPVAIKYIQEDRGPDPVIGMMREREALEKLGVVQGITSVTFKPEEKKDNLPLSKSASMIASFKKRSKNVTTTQADFKSMAATSREDADTTHFGTYLVMPYYSGKPALSFDQQGLIDLNKKLVEASIPQKMDAMYQLALQLQILHLQGTTHGDLHGGNVLVMEKKGGGLEAKLIDFDQSRQFKPSEGLSTFTGHIPTAEQIIAPEMLDFKVGAPSDVYALGLTLRAMLGDNTAYNKFDNKMDIIIAAKKQYAKSEFCVSAVNLYMSSEEGKAAVIKERQNPKYKEIKDNEEIEKKARDEVSADYQKILTKKKFTPDYSDQVVRNDNARVLAEKSQVRFQSDMPPEIKKEFEDLIDKMTAMKPEDRPTITSVVLELDTINRKLEQKNESKIEKRYIHNSTSSQKLTNIDEKKDEKDYRGAIIFLTQHMNDIGQDVLQVKNRERGFISSLRERRKSQDTSHPERENLEKDFKAVASLYDAKTSINPEKEYNELIKIIEAKKNEMKGQPESVKALSLLVERAEKIAKPPVEPKLSLARSFIRMK